MRISDWCSDVCSSDLQRGVWQKLGDDVDKVELFPTSQTLRAPQDVLQVLVQTRSVVFAARPGELTQDTALLLATLLGTPLRPSVLKDMLATCDQYDYESIASAFGFRNYVLAPRSQIGRA